MSLIDNPRAVIGDNRAPGYAERVSQELREQYAATERRVEELLARAADLPEVVNDETMGQAAKLYKEMKDEEGQIEAYRAAEKMPYFRAAQAVDAVFKPMMAQLARQTKADKPGAADIIQLHIGSYNQRKLAAERERRRVEAEELARQERDRRAAEQRARQEAEEARLAADRARSAMMVEAKRATALLAEAAASVAQTEANLAASLAEDARIATLAKPADIVRTRVDEGPLVTMGTEPYAVIEDESLLDKVTLWPFITSSAKEQALRAWARATSYNQQMSGARVGRRPRSVVR